MVYKRISFCVTVLTMVLGMTWIVGAQVDMPVFNGGLELLPEGVAADDALGIIPLGWTEWHGDELTDYSVHLTDEISHEGDYALAVRNSQGQGGLYVSTRPIAIEPGATYAALAYIYNIGDALHGSNLHVYLEFYSDDGWWHDNDYWSQSAWPVGEVPSPWSAGNQLQADQFVTKTRGEWEEVLMTAVAPEGARYMTVSFWTSHYPVNSYVDSVAAARLD